MCGFVFLGMGGGCLEPGFNNRGFGVGLIIGFWASNRGFPSRDKKS